MNRTTRFLFWELLALFFLSTIEYVQTAVGNSTAQEVIIGTVLFWLWIILMIFSIAMGLVSLRKRR